MTAANEITAHPRRRRRWFAAAIPLLAASMIIGVAVPARAFKPYTHAATGQQVLDDLSDGKVTIAGREYAVDQRVIDALTNWPQFYNAGVIGPDAFPDLTFGQSVIHSTNTGLWLRHIYTSAWEAQADSSYTATQKSQILAFAYGYLMHAAGDVWAHTLVNDFAQGVFPGVSEILSSSQQAAIALRHVIVEGYVGDATPGFDGHDDRSSAPRGDVSDDSTPGILFPTANEFGGADNQQGVSRFIYETLIDPDNDDAPSGRRGPLIDTMLSLRGALSFVVDDFDPDPIGTLENAVHAARAEFEETERQANLIGGLLDDFYDCGPFDFSCSRILIAAEIVAQTAVLGLTVSVDAIGAVAELLEGALVAATEALAAAVAALLEGYLVAWIDDIDAGLRAWPELGRASMVALFDTQARRDLQNEKCRFSGGETSSGRASCEAGIGVIDMLFHETGPFFTDYLLSMLGLPDFVGDGVELLQDVLGEIDDVVGPILGEFNPLSEGFAQIEEFAKELINSAIAEVFGIDLRLFFSIGKQPASWLNVTQLTFDFPIIGEQTIDVLFAPGDHDTLDGYLGFDASDLVPDDPPFPGFPLSQSERLADDAEFGPGDLAAFDNTVTMGKMLLLDGAGLDALLGDLTGQPYQLYSSMESGGVPANVMLEPLPGVVPTPHVVGDDEDFSKIAEHYDIDVQQLAFANGVSSATPLSPGDEILLPLSAAWLRSIDADHAWRSNGRPTNTEVRTGGDGNFPIWESCALRDKAFRSLFRDWENGDQQFPDLLDEPSPDPNDQLPPGSSTTAFSRVTLSNDQSEIGPHSSLLIDANDDFFFRADITVDVVISDEFGGVVTFSDLPSGTVLSVAELADGTTGSLADGEITVQTTPTDPCRTGTTTSDTFDLDNTPVVTTEIDENDGRLGLGAGNSLREAIAAAEPGDTITFAPILNGRTITLAGTSLVVDKDLAIDATQLNNGIVVDGDRRSRVIEVVSGTTVELSKLTVSGGDAGGGSGGGIRNVGGALTIDQSTVVDNIAGTDGGGIASLAGGSLEFSGGWVSGNSAGTAGGGISFDGTGGGSLSIEESAITGNAADEGGGLLLDGAVGTLLVNTTVAGNTSPTDQGGGIRSVGGTTATLRHVTVVGNLGVGIDNVSPATLSLENSVVANNADLLNEADDVRGDYAAVGANLVRIHTGSLLAGPVPLTDDPGLEELGPFGGRSPSMPPRVGSIVIDAAVTTAQSPDRDQRGGGYGRPQPTPGAPGVPDLGAIESQLVADARLFGLTTSAGPLDPVFLPDLTSYTVETPNSTAIAQIRPVSALGGTIELRVNSILDGDYAPIADDAISPSIALAVGSNTIDVRVTAQNGSTTKTYVLTVVRDPFSSELTALSTAPGTLDPAFDPALTRYSTAVPGATPTLTFTPTAADPQATISVFDDFDAFRHDVTSGIASTALAVPRECSSISTEVTSGDGSTTTVYTTQVDRTDTPSGGGGPEVLSHDLEWLSDGSDAAWNDPSISADGRFVAFSSTATNLVPDDLNNQEDVFVLDRNDGTIRRVSQLANGVGGNDESRHPSISADGMFVAFESEATNLVAGDTNGNIERTAGTDVFVADLAGGDVERVSLTDTGGEGNQKSITPSISGDGRFVAFASEATNLVAGFNNFEVNVYIHDRAAATAADSITAIAVPFDLLANRTSLDPDISEDGSTVVFEFGANLSGGFGYTYTDVYAYDVATQVVEQITLGNSGQDADGNRSGAPSVSADGRYVAFESNVPSLDFTDTNGVTDVFVHDRRSGVTTRVSVDGAGSEGVGESGAPSISGSGRFVAFESRVSTFAPSDTNGQEDVFMKDLQTGELRLLSQDAASTQGDGGSFEPDVSFDGRSVAFRSTSTNLGSTDPFGAFVGITNGLTPRTSADLISLTLSEAGTKPCLRPEIAEYTATVRNGVDSIRIKPVAAQERAVVDVRVGTGAFARLAADGTSAPLALAVGDNVIEARVTSANGSTTKTYRVTVTRRGPSDLSVETSTNGTDADLAPGPNLLVGDAVTWRYAVTNSGQVPLTNVAVSDSRGVAVTCPGGNPIANLAVGQTITCSAAGLAVAGFYANEGQAAGSDADGASAIAADPSHYYAPAVGSRLEIEHSTNGDDADVAPGPVIAPGANVSWTYRVTNTGQRTVRNIAVSNDAGVAVSCPGGNPIRSLATGATVNCSASAPTTPGENLVFAAAEGTDTASQPVKDTDRSYHTGLAGRVVPAGGSVGTLVPARLLETRVGPNELTIDGLFEGIGRVPAGGVVELVVGGRGGVPSDADAVFLNVTAVSPSAAGFVTVFPCGSDRPLASNVNYGPGQVVPNSVLSKVGSGRRVCLYSLAETDLIVDVGGFVPAGG